MKNRCSVTPADILLSAALVLLALALIFFPSKKEGDLVTVTTAHDTLVYPLHTDRSIQILSEGHTLTLEICDGGVCVASSDCPDGLCVEMGRVSDSSGVIVCAPAKVCVRITSSEGGDSYADIIVGE